MDNRHIRVHTIYGYDKAKTLVWRGLQGSSYCLKTVLFALHRDAETMCFFLIRLPHNQLDFGLVA